MMRRINILSGTKLSSYQFCNEQFHDWIIPMLNLNGELVSRSAQSIVIEIDDESFPSKILKIIDELIDLEGAHAIEWLNSVNWQTVNDLNISKPNVKTSNPSKYADHLITPNNRTQRELENDPKAEILKITHSYDDAHNIATNYLKKIDYSKRVYLSYDPISMSNIAWIKS